MNDALTIGAALLLGLAASGHCVLMCGGITAALGLATARDANGRIRPALLASYQLGRIASYALAGLLFAGVFGTLIAVLDIEAVRQTMRALSALTLLLAALVAFGRVHDPGHRIGRSVWLRVSRLGRGLLPVTTVPRALAFGMVWGWMPCGFVYTVLLVATMQSDAIRGALTLAAFGLGTAPAMLITGFGAKRLASVVSLPATRHVAGAVLLVSALLTLAGPWMVHLVPGLHSWLPFHK
jgi:uncharacterized protein